MRTIKLTIAYDGAEYVGWQNQPSGVSVQGLIEGALREMTGGDCPVVGAGRTDAGVHALGQAASFTTTAGIPCEGFVRGLNSLLPPSIAVLEACEAGEGFDARRDARGKLYRYLILSSPGRVPMLNGRAWQVRERLDIGAMREASGHLLGEHDFSSFRASGCTMKNAVRRLTRIGISEEGCRAGPVELPGRASLVAVEFEGNGFVRHMVRNIVGTLYEAGRGAMDPAEVGRILAAHERKEAGVCAPASGLYLVRVEY